MRLSPRTEELLSYFTGLGPVGETVEIDKKTLFRDLGFRCQWNYYEKLNRLIAGRYVRRISIGSAGRTGAFVVLKRLESAH